LTLSLQLPAQLAVQPQKEIVSSIIPERNFDFTFPVKYKQMRSGSDDELDIPAVFVQ